MSLRPERLTELLREVAQESLSLRTGSPSDAEIGREKLADLAVSYIPELVDEVRRLSVLSVLPTPAPLATALNMIDMVGIAPLADAELAELAEAQKGFPRVFVAEGLEIGTVAGWRIAKMNGNKSDNLFAQSITKVWNALPGLLARLAAAEAPKWIAVGERLPVDEIDNHDNPFGTTLYLVARPGAAYVSTNALAYRYDGDWFIVQEGAGDDADFVDNSVTHWQPLPAAPQAGKEPAAC